MDKIRSKGILTTMLKDTVEVERKRRKNSLKSIDDVKKGGCKRTKEKDLNNCGEHCMLIMTLYYQAIYLTQQCRRQKYIVSTCLVAVITETSVFVCHYRNCCYFYFSKSPHEPGLRENPF